jgi:C4-dicarboxylate-specific signal transduction histidine kinase
VSSAWISKTLVASFTRLATTLREISTLGTVTRVDRIPVVQRDEIGDLIDSANAMLDRLEEAETASQAAARSLKEANALLERRVEERTEALSRANAELAEHVTRLGQARGQLADMARRAGMSEVAGAVLHNVGNVLNSLNVSSSVIADLVRASKAVAVPRVAELLKQHEADLAGFLAGDKGRQVAEYLARLGATLVDEREHVLVELASLQKNVEHIKVIIGLQQSHARTASGVVERAGISQLLEDAIRFGATSHPHVRIERDDEGVGEIVVDRHRLFQIVVNLIRNACDAVSDSGHDGRVVVRARRTDGGDVAIEVQDDGCGIAGENLDRIFTLGFTTKRTGNGFGLHSSACAARELRGSLTVASDGPGRGARFTLTIPTEPPATAAVA